MKKLISSVFIIGITLILSAIPVAASTGTGGFRQIDSSESTTELRNEQPVSSKTLEGMVSSQTIQEVQEKLNELGYDCGIPDGISGDKTIEAVKRYQEEHEMMVSGIIDPDFAAALLDYSNHEGIQISTFLERYNQGVTYYNRLTGSSLNEWNFVPDPSLGLSSNGGTFYFEFDSDKDHIRQVTYTSSSKKYYDNDNRNLTCIVYAMNPFLDSIDNTERTVKIIRYYYDGSAEYSLLSIKGEEAFAKQYNQIISYRIENSIINKELDISIWEKDIPVEPEKEEPIDSSEPLSATPTPKITEIYDHICEADDCKEEGIRLVTGISGLPEYYCETHYQEIQKIIDKMEKDVGNGSYSKHTCIVEGCSKEGTREFDGFSGTEYYCTEHYNDLLSMFSELLK
ncbi:peptidoglycan-binding protein [Ruminococcus sp. 5_1_39BFAA]|uniref:peptidoglycan-binding domain-containing protein n=1 Tax=Ruminococcus sp. 5_1_39BFAA TaxID=457412 RepID=UPI003562182F